MNGRGRSSAVVLSRIQRSTGERSTTTDCAAGKATDKDRRSEGGAPDRNIRRKRGRLNNPKPLQRPRWRRRPLQLLPLRTPSSSSFSLAARRTPSRQDRNGAVCRRRRLNQATPPIAIFGLRVQIMIVGTDRRGNIASVRYTYETSRPNYNRHCMVRVSLHGDS